MNLVQTVSKILNREVTKEEAMEFTLNQYGVLTTFNREWEAKANPPKEKKVYALNVTDLEIGFEEMTDDEFMSLCEEQGGVYSLNGFQSAFNEEEISSSIHIIKII